MGNFTYEDLEEYKYWEDTNNYDKFIDYVDMQSAICQKNRYEKDFPDYMRRIFIEYDIMFTKILKKTFIYLLFPAELILFLVLFWAIYANQFTLEKFKIEVWEWM